MLMLSFKFICSLALKDILKRFPIYSPGGHLGHVTWIIYVNMARGLRMKFDFDWPEVISGVKMF